MIQILVPLDGSSVAELAIVHAKAIAQTFPAEITLLRVIAESETDNKVRMDSVDFALWRHQAQAYLENVRERYASVDIPIRCEVSEGSPAETVIQFMRDSQPDLLVLTRYGRGNAREFYAGGTAQKIVSAADGSVLLVNPSHLEQSGEIYQRIVVAVDDSKDSDCAVAVATLIAEVHDATLLLLQVTDEPQFPSSLPATRDTRQLLSDVHRIIRREATRRLHEMATKVPENVSVDTQVLASSDAPLAIESTAESVDCDLLVLHGSPTPPGGHRCHSAVNQSLIQFSHKPLFILQSEAADGLSSQFRSVFLGDQRREAG